MDVKDYSADSGCFAWIWNESWRNFSDRKAVSANYCLYDHNIPRYCMDIAKGS